VQSYGETANHAIAQTGHLAYHNRGILPFSQRSQEPNGTFSAVFMKKNAEKACTVR